jgi:hypothetical protein
MNTFPLVLDLIRNFKIFEKIEVFDALDKNDLFNSLKLPGSIIMSFFDDMLLDLVSAEEFNIFIEKLEVLVDPAYYSKIKNL